jgi:hypothetical protein
MTPCNKFTLDQRRILEEAVFWYIYIRANVHKESSIPTLIWSVVYLLAKGINLILAKGENMIQDTGHLCQLPHASPCLGRRHEQV